MRILFAGALLCSLSLAGCDALDTKEDLNLTDEMMATRRYQMFDWGYRVYEHIPYGFTAIDGNLFAAVSDEAQYVTTFSSTKLHFLIWKINWIQLINRPYFVRLLCLSLIIWHIV